MMKESPFSLVTPTLYIEGVFVVRHVSVSDTDTTHVVTFNHLVSVSVLPIFLVCLGTDYGRIFYPLVHPFSPC